VNFPSSWPQGCPPEDAEAASGELFRVAKTNPPSTEDFKSHEELGKKSTGPQCQRVGLSLFQTLDDAEHLIQLFPKLGCYVMSGQLQPYHGHTYDLVALRGRQPCRTIFSGIEPLRC